MEEFAITELKQIIDRYHKVVYTFTGDIAIVAHNFFLLGFKKGGQFINGSFKEWEGRKFDVDRSTKTRKVLTKGGHLSDSIKQEHTPLTQNQNGQVRVYTNHPYAAIHNNGGKIRITPQMRKFFWAMYYKESKQIRSRNDGTARRDKTNLRTNQIAEIWKSLALTKKTEFTFPARTFLYNSTNLNAEIEKLLNHRLKQI